MVVTVTMQGYIKRTPLDRLSRAHARGGKGRAGMATQATRISITELFVANRPTLRCCSSPPSAASIA
jgi:DNA gyrase subunit A